MKQSIQNKKNNIALIDGQNLHLSTMEDGWKVDHRRLRIYLKENYGVERAYYFLGYLNPNKYSALYTALQESGFILKWKGGYEILELNSEKKGNVDVDIVFFALTNFIDNRNEFNKFILISGDGDYINLVEYLIEKERLEKVLFPSIKTKSSR